MKCLDENIRLKLNDFATGHLDPAETQEVKRHLDACVECRDSLKVMRMLKKPATEANSSGHAGHLSQEDVSSYHENRHGLSPEVRSRIEAHLKSCEKCAYDLAFLNDLETELSASVRSELNRAPIWQTVLNYIVIPLRKPAVAYFLLLLAAYPTVRWFTDSNGHAPSGDNKSVPVQVFQLLEANRSSSDVPTVTRTERDALVRMDLPFYHLSSENRYEYSLFDSGKRERAPITLFANYSVPGKIQLILDTKNIIDGSYQFVVAEKSFADSLNVNESSFSFRLVTDR